MSRQTPCLDMTQCAIAGSIAASIQTFQVGRWSTLHMSRRVAKLMSMYVIGSHIHVVLMAASVYIGMSKIAI